MSTTVKQVGPNTAVLTSSLEINLLGGVVKDVTTLKDTFTHDGVGSEDYDAAYYTAAAMANSRLTEAATAKLDTLKKLCDEMTAKGLVQVINLGQVGPVGSAAGSSVSGSGAGAVAGALNGAAVGGDWVQLQNMYDGPGFDTPSMDALSTAALKDLVNAELVKLGLDPDKFSIWDERQSGKPVDCVVKAKVAKDFVDLKMPKTGKGAKAQVVLKCTHFNRATGQPVFKVSPEWVTFKELLEGWGPWALEEQAEQD